MKAITEHTTTPWFLNGPGNIYSEVTPTEYRKNGEAIPPLPKVVARTVQGHGVTDQEYSMNGHRIVACVNACANIPTEALENGAISNLLAQVHSLLDACLDTEINSVTGTLEIPDQGYFVACYESTKAAIDRLEGK